MSNDIPYIYVNVIIYPCTKPNADVFHLCWKKGLLTYSRVALYQSIQILAFIKLTLYGNISNLDEENLEVIVLYFQTRFVWLGQQHSYMVESIRIPFL